jgi:hypothetical protein
MNMSRQYRAWAAQWELLADKSNSLFVKTALAERAEEFRRAADTHEQSAGSCREPSHVEMR